MRRPFPAGPLEAAIAAGRPDFTARDAAYVLGITTRTMHSYRASGLSMWQADRFACAAGFHPAAIWPEWIDIVITMHAAEIAAEWAEDAA